MAMTVPRVSTGVAPARYTHTAVTLHWLIALLIFTLFGVGLYMADLPLSPQKLKIYSWHNGAEAPWFFSAPGASRTRRPRFRPECRHGSVTRRQRCTACSTC